MFETLLLCRVFRGMFSDEVAIVYGSTSAYVPKSFLAADQEGQGKLRVKAFEQNGLYWAVLPSCDSQVIQVEQRDLIRG